MSAGKPKGKPRGKPFAKGSSGNPAGRPKEVADVREYARQFTFEAIDGLVAIARDGGSPPAARVAAWDKVLDRAVGKAPQALTGEGGEGAVQIHVSTGIVRAGP